MLHMLIISGVMTVMTYEISAEGVAFQARVSATQGCAEFCFPSTSLIYPKTVCLLNCACTQKQVVFSMKTPIKNFMSLFA